jgi:hypothetical protein
VLNVQLPHAFQGDSLPEIDWGGPYAKVTFSRSFDGQFQPALGQQALIRDGQAAIVSKKPGSLVMIRPAAREFQSGARPVFVVGIYNPTGQPQNFLLTNASVSQVKERGFGQETEGLLL